MELISLRLRLQSESWQRPFLERDVRGVVLSTNSSSVFSPPNRVRIAYWKKDLGWYYKQQTFERDIVIMTHDMESLLFCVDERDIDLEDMVRFFNVETSHVHKSHFLDKETWW